MTSSRPCGEESPKSKRRGWVDVLLCSGLGYATCNDVGDDVARLDPREEQLADLSQPADWVQIRFS